jgi:uncharacterized protein YjdB
MPTAMKVGETRQMTPLWSSANDSVATVSSTGVVTAISPGTVEIYHTIGGISASHVVSVGAAEPAIQDEGTEVP